MRIQIGVTLSVIVLVGILSCSVANAIIGGTVVSTTDPIASTTVVFSATYTAPNGSQIVRETCTGSIIASDLIVTAAHCIGDGMNKIVFNTEFIGSGPVAPIVASVRHELYVDLPSGWSAPDVVDAHDIALVYFTSGLPDGYRPANILPDSETLQASETVTIAGYGGTGTIPEGGGTLHKTDITIIEPNWGKTELMFDQSHGHRVFFGDSGGPAFVSINGSNYLFGITSRMSGCRDSGCNSRVIYTKISAYSTWIAKTAAKLRAGVVN